MLGFRPAPEKVLAPRLLNFTSDPMSGVVATKYHTVAWNSKTIYSWGLHAGQLGHDKTERKYIVSPKQIPKYYSGESKISLVVASTGATAFLTTTGDLYVLHEYRCRKIAGK